MTDFPRLPLAALVLNDKTRAKQVEGDVWNLNLDQIEPDSGRIIKKIRVPTTKLGPSTYPFTAGTVLYSKLRPYLNKVVVADEDGVATTELVPLKCNPQKVIPPYLAYFLRSIEFLNFGKIVVSGAKMPRMVMSEFWRYGVPIPSLTEQRRIVAILDKATSLCVKRREALTHLDNLAQSVFVEMFGDPGANLRNWPLVPLRALIRGKPNNGIFRKNEEYGEGLPVAWVEELFRGYSVDLSSSRKLAVSNEERSKFGLKRGDILFCRSSLKLDGLGFNNVYLGSDDAALFECHLIRISPRHDLVDSEFLNFLLRIPSQRKRLFKFAKTVTMSTIDQEGIKNVEVPVPPLHLQKDFVEKLNAIHKSRLQMLRSTEPLDDLFQSLQQLAFKGSL